MFWSDSMQKLIIKLYEDGPITRHDQDLYGSIVGFQLINKKLKNRNLVRNVGVKENGTKLWGLTKQALETQKVSKTMEVKCPECSEKHEVSVDASVNIVDAIKILRTFFGSWQDDKVEYLDDGVKCESCGEEYDEDERICECKNCGTILKW